MEPVEISDFSKSMSEAGSAAAREKTMTRVSLIISTLAVCVALVTVLGHREHTTAVLMQARLGDQWSEFQAHKIRIQEVSDQSDLLTLYPTGDEARKQAKLAVNASNLTKWTSMSVDEARKAKEFGEAVERSEGRAGRFDLAEALLEIAVVLASITLLTHHQRYVVVGVVLGVGGVLVAASAYWVSVTSIFP